LAEYRAQVEGLQEQLETARESLTMIRVIARNEGFTNIEGFATKGLGGDGSNPADSRDHWRYGEGRLLPEERDPASRSNDDA
jgi:hypothetical protein